MLPARIPKKPKRATRWRSPAHCNFVRSHACCACAAMEAIEVAHIRLGSHAGLGQKPDDWRTISLCRDHHAEAHRIGEATFAKQHHLDLDRLAEAFASVSPKAADIRRIKQERARG